MDLKTLVVNIQEYVSKESDRQKQWSFIKAVCGSYGIRSNYEQTGHGLGRVVLYADNGCDYTQMISYECNGVILDATNNWKVLAIGNKSMMNSYTVKHLDANFSHYDVFEVIDGTIISLYYSDNPLFAGWHIGSHRAYECDNMTWMGSHTYKQVFTESLMAQQGDIGTFDELCDKYFFRGYTYNLGFQHPEWHPAEKNHRVWCVGIQDCASVCSLPVVGGSVGSEDGVGSSNELITELVKKMGAITLQMPIAKSGNGGSGGNEVTIHSLIAECQSSYKNFVQSGKKNHGYILRASQKSLDEGKVPMTDAVVLIESSLMQYIRKTVYRFHKNSPVSNEYRLNYIALRAVLSAQKAFPDHFPILAPLYNEYKKMMNDVAARVVQCMTNMNIYHRVVHTQKSADSKNTSVRIDMIAKLYLSHFNKPENRINANGEDSRSIIVDTVFSNQYLDIIYSLIFS